jgi:hypothetical protein
VVGRTCPDEVAGEDDSEAVLSPKSMPIEEILSSSRMKELKVSKLLLTTAFTSTISASVIVVSKLLQGILFLADIEADEIHDLERTEGKLKKISKY